MYTDKQYFTIALTVNLPTILFNGRLNGWLLNVTFTEPLCRTQELSNHRTSFANSTLGLKPRASDD